MGCLDSAMLGAWRASSRLCATERRARACIALARRRCRHEYHYSDLARIASPTERFKTSHATRTICTAFLFLARQVPHASRRWSLRGPVGIASDMHEQVL